MVRRGLVFFILSAFVFFLTGCASITKQKDLEIQGLKNQISVLEAQTQSKDEEISSLRDGLAKAQEIQASKEEREVSRTLGKKRKIATCEVKSRPKIKQIQVALTNAGYYSGLIDGKMGRQTREAIKAFQKANGLVADGHVGKVTWKQLREYLTKKIK